MARARSQEGATPVAEVVKRFPFLRGGSPGFRKLSARDKLTFLRGKSPLAMGRTPRLVAFDPPAPHRDEPFAIVVGGTSRRRAAVSLIKLTVQFPSGKTETFEVRPDAGARAASRHTIAGFRSGTAGDLYVSARIYYADGSTVSDARLVTVLSRNPHQLVIEPRVWLVSGRAGRVEYDWDDDEFHCRARATLTNGTGSSITYNRCRVRVTDGGTSGTLVSEFSFAVGPFTVAAGGTAYRNIDTWYPKGTDVWDRFNKRWDLTVKFTYEATNDTRVSDSAAYRPMSTVPINAIKCDDFTSAQTQAERNAVEIAAEILEGRDVTLYGPRWRIISSEENKTQYGVINVGWSGGTWDWDETHDMYEEISGPDGDRLDVFIPLALDYDDDVPADKRNVGGVSTVNGPFPKDDDPRRSGCMVLLDEADVDFFGVAIAHEICHYLGLGHVDEDDNLMHRNGGLDGQHKLTWEQWDKIRQHGMMKWLAPDL